MPELWQPIEGYEGLYEVSDQGRVKRLVGYRCRKERLLVPVVHSGYERVKLYRCGLISFHLVHRLVAAAYVRGDTSLQVNHIDGEKLNNAAQNLEWVSPRENTLHALKTGLVRRKLKENDLQHLLVRHQQGETYASIAKEFGVHPKHLGRVLRGFREDEFRRSSPR